MLDTAGAPAARRSRAQPAPPRTRRRPAWRCGSRARAAAHARPPAARRAAPPAARTRPAPALPGSAWVQGHAVSSPPAGPARRSAHLRAVPDSKYPCKCPCHLTSFLNTKYLYASRQHCVLDKMLGSSTALHRCTEAQNFLETRHGIIYTRSMVAYCSSMQTPASSTLPLAALPWPTSWQAVAQRPFPCPARVSMPDGNDLMLCHWASDP